MLMHHDIRGDMLSYSEQEINGFIQELLATLDKLAFYNRGGDAAFRMPLLETKNMLIWNITQGL